MKKRSEPIEEKLFTHLGPEEREKAIYNLDRYFEIVLGIFLRLEREREEKAMGNFNHKENS